MKKFNNFLENDEEEYSGEVNRKFFGFSAEENPDEFMLKSRWYNKRQKAKNDKELDEIDQKYTELMWELFGKKIPPSKEKTEREKKETQNIQSQEKAKKQKDYDDWRLTSKNLPTNPWDRVTFGTRTKNPLEPIQQIDPYWSRAIKNPTPGRPETNPWTNKDNPPVFNSRYPTETPISQDDDDSDLPPWMRKKK